MAVSRVDANERYNQQRQRQGRNAFGIIAFSIEHAEPIAFDVENALAIDASLGERMSIPDGVL